MTSKAPAVPQPYVHMFAAMDLLPPLFAAADAHLDAPTPCDEFTVADLLHHLQLVIRRMEALGRGESAMTITADYDANPSTADAWAHYAPLVKKLWADVPPEKMMSVPWGETPAAGTAGAYTSELVVHAWDLAVATGQTMEPAEDVCQAAFATLKRMLPVADRDEMFSDMAKKAPPGSGTERPFANADDDADGSTFQQLLAWSGRNPAWTA